MENKNANEAAVVEEKVYTPTKEELTAALIEQKAADSRSGFWQVPNSYFKRVRQMSMNEVRQECMRLAAAMVDQRNVNKILLEENNKLRAERVELNKLLEAQDVPKETESV